MKIKTKKQLNLPQLIEWAWDNDVRDKVFWTIKDNRGVSYEACFSEFGSFYSDDILDSNVIFTVEVEEEITEVTVLPNLIERRVFGDELIYSRYENVRITDIKEESSTSFYVEMKTCH